MDAINTVVKKAFPNIAHTKMGILMNEVMILNESTNTYCKKPVCLTPLISYRSLMVYLANSTSSSLISSLYYSSHVLFMTSVLIMGLTRYGATASLIR